MSVFYFLFLFFLIIKCQQPHFMELFSDFFRIKRENTRLGLGKNHDG